jgi:hypothetical protein
LSIIQGTRDFLPVTSNERNGCAPIEQHNRRFNLLFVNAELFRDPSIEVCHAPSS